MSDEENPTKRRTQVHNHHSSKAMPENAGRTTGHNPAGHTVGESDILARLIAETTQDVTYSIRLVPERHFDYISPAITGITGYTPEEFYGDPELGLKIIYPEDYPFFEQVVNSTDIQRQPVTVRWIHKNGTVLWTEQRIVPVYDENGRMITLEGVARDITERKRAEERLAQSNELLTNLARLVPGVIYQYRLYPDGRSAFPYASPGMNDIYEVTPEEVREDATPVFGRLHPEDYDHVAGAIMESARTLEEFFCEFRVNLPRQGLRWRWSQAHPERMEDGSILWHGIILDVTERKQAEEALRRSEEYNRLILDNLPIGVAVNSVDPLVTFSYMNDLFAHFYRTTREALKGIDTFWEAVYEDPVFREEIRQRVMSDCTSGDPDRMHWEDIPITRQGEETTYISARDIPVPGKQLMISIVWDVTVRKRMELERERLQAQLLQSQKLESVGRLAGGVAHDFNNMLSVILGHSELILEQLAPSNPVYPDLIEMQKAAQRSANLTRQLLAFARKQTVEPKILDLNEMVSSMFKMLKRLIGENIHLAWIPGNDIWRVKIDPSQIDQILANLTVNARDAIDGVGTITIETRNVWFDNEFCVTHEGYLAGEYVMLGVSDTGCGMDKELQEHMFEPFFTTKPIGEGSGLGLATIYGIVKQNDGFITVDSAPNRGTAFGIYLPRFLDQKDDIPESIESETAQKGSETVLLIEDEPAILAMTARILERLGYTVLSAGTMSKALRIALEYEGTIDVLITDIVMPEMNGKELEGHIKSIRPGIKSLFMSGYTSDIIARHGIIDSSVRFIHKLFTVRDLAVTLREVLNGR